MAIRSVDDASLTALADAIRAKAGLTDPLVWPDEFKVAVEGITGGAPQKTEGTFTLTADVPAQESIEIVHGLGCMPVAVYVTVDDFSSITHPALVGGFLIGGISAGVFTAPEVKMGRWATRANVAYIENVTSRAYLSDLTETTFSLCSSATAGSTYLWRAGSTVHWIAFAAIGAIADVL